MKRLLAILLSALLLISLAACGGGEQPSDDPLTRDDGSSGQQEQTGNNSNNGGTENPGGTTPDIDYGSIMAGNGSTDIIWGQQDDATKQAVIEGAKEDGYDASFGADGSLNITDPETGETYVQKPDGTWTYQDPEGGEAQIGGDWPDNEYTKLVPKPSFSLTGASSDDMSFSVVFSDASIEQMREYAEQVKAAGFNQNTTTEDQEVMGMVIYSFSASNADGYTVEIFSASGTSGMSITAP